MTRRDFHRHGSIVLGGLIKLAVAVPAVAFLVSPLRRKGQGSAAGDDAFETLTSLSQLTVGVPRSFAIIKDQTDAWVKYPSEPVGLGLADSPAGRLEARGDRLHGGVPAPGLCDQPGRRRQAVSLPLPHQRLRP